MTVKLPMQTQGRSSSWRWFIGRFYHPKFRRSKPGTAYNQRTPRAGDNKEKGDFIADGPLAEMEKWRLDKTQSLPTWLRGKVTTSRMLLSRANAWLLLAVHNIFVHLWRIRIRNTRYKAWTWRNTSWNSKRWEDALKDLTKWAYPYRCWG